jgi:hypothetical protein
MKLRVRYFKKVSDIQRESQAVPDSIKENYIDGAFEGWKNHGITAHVLKESILEERAAKIE